MQIPSPTANSMYLVLVNDLGTDQFEVVSYGPVQCEITIFFHVESLMLSSSSQGLLDYEWKFWKIYAVIKVKAVDSKVKQLPQFCNTFVLHIYKFTSSQTHSFYRCLFSQLCTEYIFLSPWLFDTIVKFELSILVYKSSQADKGVLVTLVTGCRCVHSCGEFVTLCFSWISLVLIRANVVFSARVWSHNSR